jgi:hypothetical protein
MNAIYAYLWTFAGVMLSFIFPPLLKSAGVGSKLNPDSKISLVMPSLKTLLTNRYVAITLLSLVVSLIVVAILGDQLDTWGLAVINGLGWQSILARVITTEA